jgi:hypothetical protein
VNKKMKNKNKDWRSPEPDKGRGSKKDLIFGSHHDPTACIKESRKQLHCQLAQKNERSSGG